MDQHEKQTLFACLTELRRRVDDLHTRHDRVTSLLIVIIAILVGMHYWG
jgi:hypothetical protein